MILTRPKAKASDFQGPNASSKCGIHSWAQHGVVARGVLLDFASYAEIHDIALNHYQNDKISYETLVNVGKSQGIDIRPESQGGDIKIGDILLVRSGFLKNYRSIGGEERAKMHKREHSFGPDDGQRYAGIEQSEEILDWSVAKSLEVLDCLSKLMGRIKSGYMTAISLAWLEICLLSKLGQVKKVY